MLREIETAAFERRLTLRGRRFRLVRGPTPLAPAWGARRHRALTAASREAPVALVGDGRRTCWWFEERFYWADGELDSADVLALVRDRERRRRRRLERAHAELAGADGRVPRRPRITREVRMAVFARDGGRCVDCGSDFDLQYDHLIPLALGGGSGVDNLQLLCADCNRRKGAALA